MDDHELEQYALRQLARREYSVQMLREKLSSVFTDNAKEIELLITKFIQNNWVSDRRFTEAFIEQKLKIQSWGKRKIFIHLRQKGISDELANRVWQELFAETDEEIVVAQKLAEQKWLQICRRESDTWKRKQKLQRFLVGRGFGGEVIGKVLERVLEIKN